MLFFLIFLCHFSFTFCLSISRAHSYNKGANGSWICLQAEVVSLFLTHLLSRGTSGPFQHCFLTTTKEWSYSSFTQLPPLFLQFQKGSLSSLLIYKNRKLFLTWIIWVGCSAGKQWNAPNRMFSSAAGLSTLLSWEAEPRSEQHL